MNNYPLFQPFIKAVGRGEKLKRDLTYEESIDAMRMILNGEATEAQIGAFLIAQRVKGEAVDEILGFTQVIRTEFMRPCCPRVENLLDLAVPYDGKAKSAQLAPAVAIILAEVGIPVLLHGAEDVPTKAGVGPGAVFRALGIANDQMPDDVARLIERVGVGYLDAKHFAPAWHDLMPLRRQFGLRTVLNTVEKFFNPANAPYQVSGFFHANYIERIRETQTGTRSSWMVQGEEGSIEMAAGRKSHIFATDPAHDMILAPETVGLPIRERVTLPPDVIQHADLNRAVLSGEPSPAADQVQLTVAAILMLLDVVTGLHAGMAQARAVVSSGRAQRRLDRVKNGE